MYTSPAQLQVCKIRTSYWPNIISAVYTRPLIRIRKWFKQLHVYPLVNRISLIRIQFESIMCIAMGYEYLNPGCVNVLLIQISLNRFVVCQWGYSVTLNSLTLSLKGGSCSLTSLYFCIPWSLIRDLTIFGSFSTFFWRASSWLTGMELS